MYINLVSYDFRDCYKILDMHSNLHEYINFTFNVKKFCIIISICFNIYIYNAVSTVSDIIHCVMYTMYNKCMFIVCKSQCIVDVQ